MVTATVEVEVEHRLVVCCWWNAESEKICTMIGHGGIRRYTKDNYDARLVLGREPLEYFHAPAMAFHAMQANSMKIIQLEWRAYEEMMRRLDAADSGFGYINYFDVDLIKELCPKALKPFPVTPDGSAHWQIGLLWDEGKDPSDQDLTKVKSPRVPGRKPGRPRKS